MIDGSSMRRFRKSPQIISQVAYQRGAVSRGASFLQLWLGTASRFASELGADFDAVGFDVGFCANGSSGRKSATAGNEMDSSHLRVILARKP